MSALVWLLMLVVYLPSLALVQAWAASTIWNWYMPHVFALPMLSIPAALGLACVVSIFKGMGTPRDVKGKTTSDLIGIALEPYFFSGFAVLFAWIYRHWL